MNKIPEEITLSNLEVVVMPNGEVICLGKTIGWFGGENGLKTKLTKKIKKDSPLITG